MKQFGLLALAFLAGCGNGASGELPPPPAVVKNADGRAAPTSVVAPVVASKAMPDAPLGLLTGPADALAISAFQRVLGQPASPDDISQDLLLTRLSVVIGMTATVGQFNAAAASIGASINSSRPGSPFLELAVPRQTPPALTALAQRLQTQPGIVSARPGRQASVN